MTYQIALVVCIIACIPLSFFAGRNLGREEQKKEVVPNLLAQRVISLLQERLISANNNRGFQTRTHVNNWLDGMRKDVRESITYGVINGRKSR